ncbi:MAG: glycosyltransferase family 9 protein [Bacteroidota bacterium]
MKILVLRFSSIGDIVLTTPVVAALKSQLENIEIHYLTKKSFQSILVNNPNIDQLITFEKSPKERISELKKEHYDCIIDLHKNTRTLGLKLSLRRKSYSFPKLNFKKWLLVNFRWQSMPNLHIVDRYFIAVAKLGVVNELKNCEYYLSTEDQVDVQSQLGIEKKHFIAIAIGAQFATKQTTSTKWVEILSEIKEPIVIVGGAMDQEKANELIRLLPNCTIQSTCGKYSLNQSASIVEQARLLITNDTGMMHIASCFNTKIVSIWGSTVPELGMYPYYPMNKNLFSIHEVKDLSCRPCSKIGFQKCPKGHFNCMMKQDAKAIKQDLLP